MRIIAGTARGATIAAPGGLATRPMTERVRGAIFNILREEVIDAAVLDLFAGSGSLGLEALSRGAASCVFVERSRSAARVLQGNIDALGFGDRARTLVADALRLPCGLQEEGFDLVFVDPPYGLARRLDVQSQIAGLIRNLFSGRMLEERGAVVLRTPRRAGPLWLPETVAVADLREYGADLVRFLRRSN